ncbi:MAG: hypothetical protein JF600_18275 [Xanthomonadales bacterium]|nr:hypothetical protein [Xanthomonadales bacterium]
MIAPKPRHMLAAIGRDLIASDGGPAERRANALLRSLSGTARPPIALNHLYDVPDWLRLPRAALQALAQRAALLSMAPALAASIDGALLGAHARVAGEDAVDWAMARAARVPGGGLPPVEASRLTGRGSALMRMGLPAPLRDLVGPETETIDCPADLVKFCLAETVAGARAA